jgi:hypothetical protein
LRQHARYSVGTLGEGRLAYSSHSPRTELNRSSANPSTNVSTLIVNLNEYILHIFDTFFELAEAQRAPFTVDELFSEISIIEDARQHELLRVRKNEIDQSNAGLVLGLLPR